MRRLTATPELLDGPLEAFLFVPAQVWEGLQGRTTQPVRVVGKHRDLYRGYDVVVVTNR